MVVDVFKQALGNLSTTRVLDIATGEGAFIRTLMRNLKSYERIIGIDATTYTEAAENPFATANIHFIQMDAAHLGFPDESFDAVSISSSLHHLENTPRCLAEVKRVLRPRGYLIIRETHADAQTEAQLTDIYLHRWVAEIDSALGLTHNRISSRQELVAFGKELELSEAVFYDIPNTDSDARDESAIEETEWVIDRYSQLVQSLPGSAAFQQQGEDIRRRLYEVGIQWEPELLIIGRKPWCTGQVEREAKLKG